MNDEESWEERAAHLIYDDHVHGMGLASLLQPPWSSLTDKSRWLSLARHIEHIERNHGE